MEAALVANDFDEFRRLTEDPQVGSLKCRHCSCIDDKAIKCQHLLSKAVELKNMKFVEYMLEHDFPVCRTSLLLAVKQGDEQLMHLLYAAGCRFASCDNIFYVIPSLSIVRAAIEKCEYPILDKFRHAVEYVDDEVLEYVYGHLLTLPQTHVGKVIDIVGPGGYTIANIGDQDTRFGFKCYHNAIYHGTLERFIKVAQWCIPMYNIDLDFWCELLHAGKNALNTRMYSDAAWKAKDPGRQKILAWCIEHEFSFNSHALSAAILYKNEMLTQRLLQLDVSISIDAKVISAALLSHPLDLCKELLARGSDKALALEPNVWTSVAGGLACNPLATEKLTWLSDVVKCPHPHKLIASIIHHAPIERLDWLINYAGFKPTIECWAALSNRYMMDDTEKMLHWLSKHNCPLDKNVRDHMDICRPYACSIIGHVETRLAITFALCDNTIDQTCIMCRKNCGIHYCCNECADDDDDHDCISTNE